MPFHKNRYQNFKIWQQMLLLVSKNWNSICEYWMIYALRKMAWKVLTKLSISLFYDPAVTFLDICPISSIRSSLCGVMVLFSAGWWFCSLTGLGWWLLRCTHLSEYGGTHLRSMPLTVGKVLFLFFIFYLNKIREGQRQKKKREIWEGCFSGSRCHAFHPHPLFPGLIR